MRLCNVRLRGWKDMRGDPKTGRLCRKDRLGSDVIQPHGRDGACFEARLRSSETLVSSRIQLMPNGEYHATPVARPRSRGVASLAKMERYAPARRGKRTQGMAREEDGKEVRTGSAVDPDPDAEPFIAGAGGIGGG